jgi:thiol:disulfide interchange protein DsbD
MKTLLILILAIWSSLMLLSASAEEDFLDPDIAFSVNVSMKDGQNLTAKFKVAEHYYLYQERISFAVKSGNVQLGKPMLPTAILKNDPNFGDVYIYKQDFNIDVPVSGQGDFEVIVKYQGCAAAGLCYPPQKKTINLSTATLGNSATNNAVSDFLSQAKQVATVSTPETKEATVSTPVAPTFDNAANAALSETDQITNMLSGGNTWVAIAFFFGIGLLLAFTPCVFPMIPILSSIIVGQGAGLTTRRAFTLSLVYVLAMALTYTAAGVLAGLFGANLQAAFQNPWILISFSAIFVLLALSMFGFYELQLPASVQAKLADVSNKQQGGTLTGVAIMGLLSALIVGPCVAPPLAGALIYIGQTGDALLGGAALFALSMGMGVPLLLIGTAAGKYMPRAGGWMDNVKAVFGVSLLAVAIWMLSRILPDAISLLLWAVLAIGSAVYLGALEAATTGWQKLSKTLGLILLTWALFLLIAVASGGNSVLTPLAHLVSGNNTTSTSAVAHANFRNVNNITDLETALSEAKNQGKPVMLDFYADWCVSCKEMGSFTFSDQAVTQRLNNMVLLQVDMTANTAEQQAVLKRFGLVGPPAILFFNANGQEQRNLRVVGFMKAQPFAAQLDKALGK